MGKFQLSDIGSALRNAVPILDATTYILDSTPESADRAESAAREMARRAGLPETKWEHVGIVVHEITLNAVVHGNRSNIHNKVIVTIERTRHTLQVVIADQGKGFDLDAVSDPLPPHGIVRGSGRGIFLARRFMDEFSVQRDRAGWHRVTMVKYL
jgi:anti-sigma regulatory factor (Ser/Thr protein kinase)